MSHQGSLRAVVATSAMSMRLVSLAARRPANEAFLPLLILLPTPSFLPVVDQLPADVGVRHPPTSWDMVSWFAASRNRPRPRPGWMARLLGRLRLLLGLPSPMLLQAGSRLQSRREQNRVKQRAGREQFSASCDRKISTCFRFAVVTIKIKQTKLILQHCL